MKKVVFIAGTAYSGSSMLDMMIGNSESSFSMGEVKYLFQPLKIHHINPKCDCGKPDCNIWQQLVETGKNKLYDEVYDKFKHIDTIIDSSKDLFWISEQRKQLRTRGIDCPIILIWKSPVGFASSRYKRNDLKGWDRAWINYHKMFFAMNKNEQWWSVEYRELAIDPANTLKQICDVLSVPNQEKMEHYWNKNHHMLFGNLSAKYHNFKKGENKYQETMKNINRFENVSDNSTLDIVKRHRKIVYDPNYENKLPASVIERSKSAVFKGIISAIQSRNIKSPNTYSKIAITSKKIMMPTLLIRVLQLKKIAKERLFYFKNRHLIKRIR